MNKTIKTAFEAATKTNNAEIADALKPLAVEGFRDAYVRVQKAIKTINRHTGVNRGTPNRAKMAVAIGLFSDITDYADIAKFLGMTEMEDAAEDALNAVAEIRNQRDAAAYTKIAELADFYTNEERNEIRAEDDKRYLYNCTRAAIRAINSINRHCDTGDYNPNTNKIAKIVGYYDTIDNLAKRLAEDKANGLATDREIAAVNALVAACNEIFASKDAFFAVRCNELAEYDPYATEEETNVEGTEEEVTGTEDTAEE